MPNTNYQTIHQFGSGVSQMVRQATGRDSVESIEMDWVSVEQTNRYETHEETGDPVMFETNVVLPVKVTAQINPVQDLHGFDAPWAGGAGKNILDSSELEQGAFNGEGADTSSNARVRTGYIPVLPNTMYMPSCESGKEVTAVHYYDSNKSSVSNENVSVFPFTTSSTTYYVRVAFKKSDGSTFTPSELTQAQLEQGSSATSFVPYSNICPISGWDSVQITRTGKNLLDVSAIKDVTTVSGIRKGIEITMPGNYVLKNNKAYGSSNAFYTTVVTNGVPASAVRLDITNAGLTKTQTINSNQTFLIHGGSGIGADTLANYITNAEIQLEFGSTPTSYEEYVGKQYPISLPTTAYGGTLTVNTDGTGTLSVEWDNIASYNGETLPGIWISDRDVYAEGTTPTIGSQVVYELATPDTYTLSELDVIETLAGNNNIWSDTGPVSVIYKTKEEII